MELRGGAACKQESLMRFSSGLPHAICNITLSRAPGADRAIAVEPDGPWKRPGVFQSAGLGGRRSGLCDRELAGPVLTAAPFPLSVDLRWVPWSLSRKQSGMGTKIFM